MKRSKYDLENDLSLFMDIDEERNYYEEVLQRVIQNPRYYLDNLDELYVFRCSFINYYQGKRKVYKENVGEHTRTEAI